MLEAVICFWKRVCLIKEPNRTIRLSEQLNARYAVIGNDDA